MSSSVLFPNLTKMYHDMLDAGDPRVATWPMMDSPMKAVTLVLLYLAFVKVAGPALMRDQKPYDLRYVMATYNFFMVIASAWIFFNFGMLGWFTKYNWRCEPVDYSNSPDAVRVAEIGWFFFITKFVEFADTVFFILRKKDSQISNLHVFHHSLVPITLWFGIKYAPGGYNTIFALLNSFVHIFMYAYYGLAALGPSFHKYLWWKKYLTVLQMVQFTIVFFYMFQLTFSPTCEVSKAMLALNVVQAIIFFVLFSNFFREAYRKKQRRQRSPVPAPAESGKARDQQRPQNGYVHHRKIASVHSDDSVALKYLDVNYIAETLTIAA